MVNCLLKPLHQPGPKRDIPVLWTEQNGKLELLGQHQARRIMNNEGNLTSPKVLSASSEGLPRDITIVNWCLYMKE